MMENKEFGRLIKKEKLFKFALDEGLCFFDKRYYRYKSDNGLHLYYHPYDSNDADLRVGSMLVSLEELNENDIEEKNKSFIMFTIDEHRISKGYKGEDTIIPYVHLGFGDMELPDLEFSNEFFGRINKDETIVKTFNELIDKMSGPEELGERRIRSILNENLEVKDKNNKLEEQLSKKDEEIISLSDEINNQKEQISNLQNMLTRVLEFAEKVKNSAVGKIFFRKSIKELPSGEDIER